MIVTVTMVSIQILFVPLIEPVPVVASTERACLLSVRNLPAGQYCICFARHFSIAVATGQ